MFGLGKKAPPADDCKPAAEKPKCYHDYRLVADTGPWDIRICGKCRHALVKIAPAVIERAAAEYAVEQTKRFYGPNLEIVAEVKPRKGARKRR